MGFSLEHAFVVKAPVARVWAYLTDPYRVAPALPGAAVTEKRDDGSYGGTMTVKVGPVSARYKGTLRFENADEAARSAELVASGQDTSGRGGANLRMKSRLHERAPGETEVTMVSDVNVTGILAQFGRGMIQDVSNQMFQKFVEAARAELEQPAPEPSTNGAASSSTATNGAAGGGAPAAAAEPAPAVAPAPAAEPVQVVTLGAGVLGRALLRTAKRPGFWIFVLLVLLALYWLRSR